jgi:hypothetical protein
MTKCRFPGPPTYQQLAVGCMLHADSLHDCPCGLGQTCGARHKRLQAKRGEYAQVLIENRRGFGSRRAKGGAR